MRRILSTVLIICLTAFFVPVGSPASTNQVTDEIRLFIPSFSGPEKIGFNVSTFINLQVFKTLRKAPTPNPGNLDFGDGKIVWSNTELSAQTHRTAATLIKRWDLLAQMALWGKAWEYGNGLIVQPYLTIPRYKDFRANHFEVWSKTIEFSGKTYRFNIDLPRRFFMFSLFYLDKDFIDKYKSPLSIKIYNRKNTNSGIAGSVGKKFRAQIVEGEWVKIRSGQANGWVRLEKYSEKPIEIIDFVGGMIRVFRNDWKGAYELFENVTAAPESNSGIKVDALLLQARALEELGRDGSRKLDEALSLSPYSYIVIKYRLMKLVSDFQKALKSDNHEDALLVMQNAEQMLAINSFLLPPESPFFNELKNLILAVKSR